MSTGPLKLSETWLKAAVLGCLWASSEILLGSFLHNFRIPFSGNFLTAIAIILMVAIGQLWKDRGLFLRAGLICALMKSVSPSAVILGPMIAIFSEAALMEGSVLMLGRNIAGYLLGSMLAMTWTLFHKIATFLIYYGFNMVEIYRELTGFAEKQLQVRFHSLWDPVLILWGLYMLMGIASAFAGLAIGRRTVRAPASVPANGKSPTPSMWTSQPAGGTPPSLTWLGLNLAAMILTLWVMNSDSWILWSSAGILIIGVWTLRYRRALKPLAKPKFWIWFVLITLLASFLLTPNRGTPQGWADGLVIGLRMSLRAAVMIIGFSVTGRELANPVIRRFFSGTRFHNLPPAMELAFDTLPHVIAAFPDLKSLFRDPFGVLHQVVSQANGWLERMTASQAATGRVVIITGGTGSGKTTLLDGIVKKIGHRNIPAGGIIAPAVFENGDRTGYDLVNVATGERTVLARTSPNGSGINAGRYWFLETGIGFGRKALDPANNLMPGVMVLDEIGPLELDGQGWADSFDKLVRRPGLLLIVVARRPLLEKVIQRWSLHNPWILDVSDINREERVEQIVVRAAQTVPQP
ncbi:MAG TPA: nucleoside-triphosphatase [Bacteroidales bacterium]|nr:nucleoside-triphosphatase [Bacteroidales bacterium]HPS62281.1 nucleoside-triphosphatase [Bacteroidales bacterium]